MDRLTLNDLPPFMSYLNNDQQGNLAGEIANGFINPASLSNDNNDSQHHHVDDAYKIETHGSTAQTHFPTPSSSNEQLVDFDSGDSLAFNYNLLPTPESSPFENSFNLDVNSATMSHQMSNDLIHQNFGNSLGMFYPTPSTSSAGSAASGISQLNQSSVEQEFARILSQSGASAQLEQQMHEEERQRIMQAQQQQQQHHQQQQHQQQQHHHQRMMLERMQRVNLSQQQQAQQQAQHHPYRIAEQSTRSIRRKQSAPAVRSIQPSSVSMSVQPSATIAPYATTNSTLGRIDESEPSQQTSGSSCHRNIRAQKLKRQTGPRKAVSMPSIRQVASIQTEERNQPKVTKSPGGISFINFTQEHAETLIAGVAPSGSNKRKKKQQQMGK